MCPFELQEAPLWLFAASPCARVVLLVGGAALEEAQCIILAAWVDIGVGVGEGLAVGVSREIKVLEDVVEDADLPFG